jgi:hypothetical protein
MRIWATILTGLLLSSIGYTMEYKVFWRCQEGRFEALDLHPYNDKKVDLFLTYIEGKKKELTYSPISVKSLVELPAYFNSANFLMLSNGKRVFMNCVGQVILTAHHHEGRVIFDVRRHAYQCPLIPKGC